MNNSNKLKAKMGNHVVALITLSVVTFVVSLGFFLYLLVGYNTSKNNPGAVTYGKDQIIVAVNLQRKIHNLQPLIFNEKLAQASNQKATDLSKNSYFSHTNPLNNKKWSDFITESSYDYLVAGENLANGFYDANSMVKAWMESPSHRENILNSDVDETAIGISAGNLNETPTIFVVQLFGKRE